jgi:hypothetical protein
MLNQNIKEKILNKLLSQYEVYLDILAEINKTKLTSLKVEGDEEKRVTTNRIKILNKILDKTSEEMTFPLPSIWIMYKFHAYKNSDKEIFSVRDFGEHCSPEGYICTKRFTFLKDYFSFEDFNNTDSLESVFSSPILKNLENNADFLGKWLENEYKIVDGKIAKWE